MEQTIKDKINSATSMKEAEQFAEKLTYELSYEHKTDSWRTRYEYLRQEDFRKLGWKVFCVGCKTKQLQEWLVEKGFVAHEPNKIYYLKEQKEMFMIGEYANGELISIDDYRKGEPKNLLSLDEYKTLLIDKLLILNEAKNKVQAFVDGMIQEHKDFLANEENEYLKTQIINEALEKAKELKLII